MIILFRSNSKTKISSLLVYFFFKTSLKLTIPVSHVKCHVLAVLTRLLFDTSKQKPIILDREITPL